jgi:MFS family permease
MIPGNFYLRGWQDPKKVDNFLSQDDLDAYDASFSYNIPLLICLNDLITCIGAGMTVKYFPLFFANDFNLSPMHVQLIFIGYLISVSIFTMLCEKLSSIFGRIQAVMVFSIAGTTCLYYLSDPSITYLPLVIGLFMLRGAFQNAIYPIDRSILMDHVQSNQRGRWNAVESVSTMTWSGSAMIGGYLMDHNDYRYAFRITALIYAVGLLTRIPMLWMVKDRKEIKVL